MLFPSVIAYEKDLVLANGLSCFCLFRVIKVICWTADFLTQFTTWLQCWIFPNSAWLNIMLRLQHYVDVEILWLFWSTIPVILCGCWKLRTVWFICGGVDSQRKTIWWCTELGDLDSELCAGGTSTCHESLHLTVFQTTKSFYKFKKVGPETNKQLFRNIPISIILTFPHTASIFFFVMKNKSRSCIARKPEKMTW